MTFAGCAELSERGPLPKHPTIVSLNPCTDAILAEVAPPSQVLALSHYSRDPAASSMDPAKAREFGTTGGTVEEVLALDPDVVIASDFLAPATRAALADLDIRVETVGIAGDVESSLRQVRKLARVAGRPERGEALAAEIASAVRARPAAPAISTVLWQPGGIVPGEGALVTRLMQRAGLSSHSAARGLSQADYLSLERLLADPPQLLLVAGNERGQMHEALDALQQMRVERFDPALLYCGGPTIVRAMKRLREVREAGSGTP